jgi:hypothetical protein
VSHAVLAGSQVVTVAFSFISEYTVVSYVFEERYIITILLMALLLMVIQPFIQLETISNLRIYYSLK